MDAAASSVVGKVVDLLCGVAKKEISYICNCSENVEKYKNEAEKLSGMKGRVQQQIASARSKGELLLEGVEDWMKKADADISVANGFINQEAQEKCFNLRTLRRRSKTAISKRVSLQQHQENGKSFETRVSLPAQSARFTDLYQRKNLDDINTQKLALEEIIRAIEDKTIQIVGINGLGGVGKTTLASEVAKEIKNQFEDIVFIPVSKTVDVQAIQEKVRVAASEIINGKKVLIILDDVWKELKLEELGIPCGSAYMNCKILLTSRRKDVGEAMNAQKNITVIPLKDDEAWTLFERVVGKSEWDDTLKGVALEIVSECGGLPLFIQALGKALKDKKIEIWKATLRRLQAPMDGDISYQKEGILQLKLSYDYLEDEVTKSCFLLCSLFPEDEYIGLKKLTHYGLALGIFNNPDSIHDTKDIVQLAVESLKSSFLLLPAEKNFYSPLEVKRSEEEKFKMHDLVRDMALFITSKGDDKFLVKSGEGLREWQPRSDVIKSYKKISLMENNICKLPNYELDIPHLDTFLIQNNQLSIVPDELFRGMKELKVLDMRGNNISSLPQSLTQLTILRLLDLSRNRSLCEISILGGLSCLEILKLRGTGIKNIPEEIGQLTNLRLLDVYYCNLSYVTPGVISKLVRLEELYVGLVRGECNFLVELSELTLLKILHLIVHELYYIPKIETLIEFDIRTRGYARGLYKRCLGLSGDECSLTMPIRKLIQQSESLTLSDMEYLDNILPDLYHQGFDELRYIKLLRCRNVRSLVKTCDLDGIQTSNERGGPMKTKGKFFSHLEQIDLDYLERLELLWDNPHQYISFCNLMRISINACPFLLKLFPISVAQGLVNLKDIEIDDCESLVKVISDGDEQTSGSEIELETNMVFSFEYIRLFNLPKLESFYSGHSIIKYPSLEDIVVFYCPSMKRWSYGENHTPKIKFYDEERECSINDYIAGVDNEKNGNFTMTRVS